MSKIKIVLDAGHFTGFNPSPVYPAYHEGNMTWDLHLLLAEWLRKFGFEVTGTRRNRDDDLPVWDRGYRGKGADLLISLHSNACDAEGVRRVVVIPPFADQFGCLDLAHRMAKCVTAAMGIEEDPQIYTSTYIDDWGRTRDYYGVIRGAIDAGCKRAMIIEHSFHTNEESAKWLHDTTNLSKLAEAEAREIAHYFGIEYTEDEMKEIEELKKICAEQKAEIEALRKNVNALAGADLGIEKQITLLKSEMKEKEEPVYAKVRTVPSWGRDTARKLVNMGIIRGTGSQDGEMLINLSETMLRILVMCDRAGVFGE